MPPSRRPWAYAETSLVRKAQANAFQRAAQELGRENVAAEDWNRIFGGQTAAALDQKYATQQPATTAEPPKKKNRFGRFVDNLQSADFDDALGDIIHGGAVALAAPKEYLADPFMGIGSGATSRESKELLDANGNPTGRYYRDVHENSKHWGFIDVGSFARTAKSLKDFAKDPVGQYQEGRRAWDEAMASPENNAFVRTAVQTATDPTLYIGQGTVGGLAKGLSARGLLPTNPAVRAALMGRYSPVGGLLEGASAKGALGIALGAGAGAQAAESFDIPWAPEGLEQVVLPLAGGALAGGWAGKAKLPSARPWKGAETATRAELGWDVQAMEEGGGYPQVELDRPAELARAEAFLATAKRSAKNERGFEYVGLPPGVKTAEDLVNLKERLLRMAAEDALRDSNESLDLYRAGSDGNFFTNDWREKPNGEDYRSRIAAAGRPGDFADLEASLKGRLARVDDEYIARFGWDQPGAAPAHARAFENGTEGPAGLAFEAAPARALATPGGASERAPYTGPRPGVENAERLAGGAQPARGKKALINRILMEARRGREGSGLQGVGLDEEAARAAVEFIDALPEQYTELLASSFVSGRDISGRTASAGARVAGTYDPATALITIAKGITNSSADPQRVIVHEIAHHLERFVTQEDHAALLRQYQREMGTPGILPGSGQGGEALRRAQGALEKLAADPHAALTAEEAASLEGLYRWQGGLAEWFAENIADRALRDRYPAPVKSAFERAREHVANLLIGAYNFLLRRGERDAAERVYQKLLRGDYEAFDTRLGADGGPLAMAVGPSRYEKQQNVKNARATARTVGADLFASAPAADVRAGQAAYLNSARGRIDNGIRKALAQVPGAVSMDRNLVKDTDVTPFVVQERTRLGNVIDSYEGLADYLMQRVEGAGLKAAFDPEDGNYWVEVGGQRLQFGDLVEGSTQEAQLARAALSREQQAALAEVADFNASLNENLRYHGRSLPFDDSTDNAYFPRVVVGADGVGRPMLPGTGGGLATGGPWAKERTQAAMEAGVADRKLNYANPREAFRLMVRSKLKVAADSRIAEALRPLGQSAEDVNKAGGVAGVTHVELGPTVAPSLNGVYFDGPTAERILAGLKGKPAADVGALRAVNSALTPLRAMGDVSWFGQQGAAFLFRHPLRASRAAVTVIRSAMGDASGYRKLMDGALAEGAERAGIEVAEYRKLLIANGLHFVPDELGETGIGFTSGARRLPVAGKVATFSNETFARYLNLARVMFANDAVELALKTNRMDELQGALASVNRMTGATGRKPSSAESLVEFAPRFFSAAVEQTFAAVTKGGLEGTIARRHLARMLGTGALITIAANASRGYDTDLDPTSDNFLRIRNVGGLDVSLFGTYSTFFKALARTSTGDTAAPLRLLEGKLSPAVGLIYWPVKGETYLGEPLSPRGDPVGTVYEYGKSMLPFGLQTMVDQGIEPAVRERDAAQLLEGLKSELASGTGLTSTPMSAVERRDFARGDRSESALMVRPEALGIGARQGAAQREYGMDYDQLSGADKSRVNERPDVKGYQAEADRNALTRDDDRSKMTQSSLDIGKKLDALSEEFASGQISGNEFREQYRRLQDELRGARNAVGGGSKGVLGGWFALYDQAQLPDGRVNYERLDALQAAYREQHPEIDDEVARITGVHDNEVMRQYRQAQALAREYYALPAYRGLSLEEGQTAGRVIDIAQAMVQAGMARTIRQAFAQLATQDKEAVRLARIAMNRGANPQRRAFRRANPLFAQFYGDVAQL